MLIKSFFFNCVASFLQAISKASSEIRYNYNGFLFNCEDLPPNLPHCEYKEALQYNFFMIFFGLLFFGLGGGFCVGFFHSVLLLF